MSSQTTKELAKQNRAAKISKSEKITNDFLLQFAYSIILFMVVTYIYNASVRLSFGWEMSEPVMRAGMVLCAVSALAGIAFAVLAKLKGRNGFKITSIYCFVTAAAMGWCCVLEKILYRFPAIWSHINRIRMILMMFGFIALSVVVELAVYFIRIYRLKHAGKKRK